MSDSDIPAHRTTTAARSGDTHVIGADGAAVNIDAQAREAAEREQAEAARKQARAAAKDPSPPA